MARLCPDRPPRTAFTVGDYAESDLLRTLSPAYTPVRDLRRAAWQESGRHGHDVRLIVGAGFSLER